jgi:mono/diheme cytochrome c family protein
MLRPFTISADPWKNLKKDIHIVKRLLTAALALSFISSAHATPDGAALYAAKCAMCHQADGHGIPAQYPPLAGRVATIASNDQGRAYLGHVLINGMTGMLRINNATYVGYMPSFRALTDADIAAVLTHVASLGATGTRTTIDADTVHAARTPPLSPTAVSTERRGLVAAGIVP